MRKGMTGLWGVMLLAVLLAGVSACRKPQGQLPEDNEELDVKSMEGYRGFFVLNNGGAGSNKATLDYYDASKRLYQRNIFAQRNPQDPNMGDDATDMAYHNGRLYVALRGSHKVLMLDGEGKYLGEMAVNECEKLLFHNGKGYVTSLRKKGIPLDQPPYGEVICFNPATLEVLGSVIVGCQPAGMVLGGTAGEERLYVSNSGRFRTTGYDNQVSVVDVESFEVVDNFTVGLNPNAMCLSGSFLTTLASGDYSNAPASVSMVSLSDGKPNKEMNDNIRELTPVDLKEASGTVYCLTVAKVMESGWNGSPRLQSFSATFGGKPDEEVPASAMEEIQNATGLSMHPSGDAVYVFDSRNFTSSGTIYCYALGEGKPVWKVRAGIQPIDMEFVKE